MVKGELVGAAAAAGWNSFKGDVTFRDCNGALVDVPRRLTLHFTTARCLREIGIKPY